MLRTALTLAMGILLGTAGLLVAQHQAKSTVVPISSRDIVEKLDGHDAKVSVVEVQLDPLGEGMPHRHPGPVFGYVLEGKYELGIDDQPTKIFEQGETFYEPTGCLHRVSKNPQSNAKTRVIAVVLHPRDAKQLAIPEPMDKP
ncbi:cupin domain-containing protein [Bremerella sp. T1]|uniref:cupin domain-containing protein n=1 Tax=Bremerella sp. TYQ1 TaxID=3119568 RepID=UPI001CC97536|nr:cupin domain-containing protein [Bremerella volcania]UBM34469.1 cupin domain-containing protein [Bremerella volcania]